MVRRLFALLLASAPLFGASACCSATATKGCLTPERIHAHAAKHEAAPLLGYLRDERSWVREEAAASLGVLRDGQSRAPLEAVLRDEHERPWVRAAAARSLGVLDDASVIPALGGVVAAAATAPEVKLAAIEALCRYAALGPEPIQIIQPLTGDEDVLVAALAAESVATRCGGAKR